MNQQPLGTRNDSHVLQRLQIGSVGVIAVLLMVAMASLVLEGASDEPSVDPLAAQEPAEQSAEAPPAEDQPNEPLVDLGVVPDIAPDESLGDPEEVLNEDEVPDLPNAPGDAEPAAQGQTQQ
ncbi:hypothetical protein [Alterisphingorhabdus coralli]|uniref:Uncharacterized protein n=1 Tax=Alterisphingorhabdus coralli TaxID=3071408 RepID=A0AA97F8X5_9SPHN|nr:hypothetical protein [Parasphingorhabdus sp. SCSIO 66989]WOE76138.1 hypothetical protein RB602_05335 [Parasphingorhabdus sp. SCSIO 66989]